MMFFISIFTLIVAKALPFLSTNITKCSKCFTFFFLSTNVTNLTYLTNVPKVPNLQFTIMTSILFIYTSVLILFSINQEAIESIGLVLQSGLFSFFKFSKSEKISPFNENEGSIKPKKKSIYSRFKLGIIRGWVLPNLPQDILDFQLNPIIRILRFLGGLSILIIISKRFSMFGIYSNYCLYICVFFGILFTIYHFYIVYHRIKFMRKVLKNKKDLEIRNSP